MTRIKVDPIQLALLIRDGRLTELEQERRTAYQAFVDSVRQEVRTNSDLTMEAAAERAGMTRQSLYELFRTYPTPTAKETTET